MRHLLKTAALALLPLVIGSHAQAAENGRAVITLSCDGTLTRTYGANKPADAEPLQKTIAVVNLDEQTRPGAKSLVAPPTGSWFGTGWNQSSQAISTRSLRSWR
jgi:hypothetical protein